MILKEAISMLMLCQPIHQHNHTQYSNDIIKSGFSSYHDSDTGFEIISTEAQVLQEKQTIDTDREYCIVDSNPLNDSAWTVVDDLGSLQDEVFFDCNDDMFDNDDEQFCDCEELNDINDKTTNNHENLDDDFIDIEMQNHADASLSHMNFINRAQQVIQNQCTHFVIQSTPIIRDAYECYTDSKICAKDVSAFLNQTKDSSQACGEHIVRTLLAQEDPMTIADIYSTYSTFQDGSYAILSNNTSKHVGDNWYRIDSAQQINTDHASKLGNAYSNMLTSGRKFASSAQHMLSTYSKGKILQSAFSAYNMTQNGLNIKDTVVISSNIHNPY